MSTFFGDARRKWRQQKAPAAEYSPLLAPLT
jgi:hypothetical protein